MSDIIAERDKRNVPLLLRFVLWIVVAILCGVIEAAANIIFPFYKIIPRNVSTEVNEFLAYGAGPGIYGALISLFVQKIFSKAYKGIRSL